MLMRRSLNLVGAVLILIIAMPLVAFAIRDRLPVPQAAGSIAQAASPSLVESTQAQPSLPPEKQAMEELESARRAAAAGALKPTDHGPNVIQTDGPAAVGMLGAVNAPMPGAQFTPENAWAGWTDATTYVQVWAGGPADGSNGLVLIITGKGNGGVVDSEDIGDGSILAAPEGSVGTLHIRDEQDGILTIADSGGHTYTFDPATAAFVVP